MLKNSFLGRRDEPSSKDASRASIDSPLYPPRNDAPPLSAVAVTTNHVSTSAAAANGAAASSTPALRTFEPDGKATPSTTANSGADVRATGPRLTVGPNIKLKGAEINDCDTLVVEGHVEASMDSKVLEILQSGSYDGTVTIDVAEIHGKFSGNLTARKRGK
jgi:Polymer-forming cytoskeletal